MTTSMFVFVFGVMFSVHFISYECEGMITSPTDREYLFLPGQTGKIRWEFDDTISDVRIRLWTFTSKDGLFSNTALVSIDRDGPTDIETSLFEVDIERPATLVLKNVNQSYNGVYRFSLTSSAGYLSNAIVSIASPPTVKLNCSSRNELNECGNFTCLCRGEGGIPGPSNVTWYKDGVQIGETKKENNTLSLTDVNASDSGTFKCVAQSYPTDAYKDEKSIQIMVNVKPTVTLSCPNRSEVKEGDDVICVCKGEGGNPPANVTWYKEHQVDVQIGETKKENGTLNLTDVKSTDSGTYTCVAQSYPTAAFKDEKSIELIVKCNCKTVSKDNSSGTEWYIVVVSLVSGIIVGIIFSYIVSCSHRRWFRNGKSERKPEPGTTEVNTTYQELDLTKMNTEDNYQSLRMIAASDDTGNDDDPTYTQLKKNRDVENNYESLN